MGLVWWVDGFGDLIPRVRRSRNGTALFALFALPISALPLFIHYKTFVADLHVFNVQH